MIPRLVQRFLVGVVVIVTGLTAFTNTLATTRFWYTVTDLGSLGGNSYASDINNAGQVVGWYDSASSWSDHGFFWQNGKMTDIASICAPMPFPPRINNAGQVVGNCNTTGILWKNKTTTNLPLTYAYDINDAGTVVGMLDSPVAWNQQDGINHLGTLGSFFGNAQGINNQGSLVAVASANVYEPHTFLWKNSTPNDIGTLFYPSSLPPARINNKEQIVGTTIGQSGSRAILWQNGNTLDLGTLGGRESFPTDINKVGKVVGFSETSSRSSHAFVWFNNKMRDLNNLLPPNSGWELTQALGINDKGQIVGYGTHDGQIRAFLLTPRWLIQ
jgi:probable HAF family extracellular repeat protein